jgi:MFS family permease
MPDTVLPRPSVGYRWIVLVFLSVAMGGNYYIYDSINPLEDIFKQQLGFNATQFGWLNISYSIAAIVTLLIGGIIIDRIGTKKAITVFAVLCLLGALITAAKGKPAVMIAGRTVLGLGAESMIVAVTTALAKWFKGKELSFAFGINLTIARLASVAADNSPTWAKSVFYPEGAAGAPSWKGPLLLAVGAGVLSVVTAFVYWVLERKAEGRYELGKGGDIDKLEFKQIFKFNLSYWYVVGLCFTFYSAIFPFRTFAIEFFRNKTLAFQGGEAAAETVKLAALQLAGRLNSLLPLCAMIATPLVRPGRQESVLHDVRLISVDARLPHDGLLECFVLRTRSDDGYCIFAGSGCDVALGGLHRGPIPSRNGLCLDDPYSADRVCDHERRHWQSE